MKYWTLSELVEDVTAHTDTEGETFVSSDDLRRYANEAIDEVERQIHTLYEDYFLTRGTVTLVNGQEEYDLPSDIYAMKIRGIIYRNGTDVLPMTKIKDWRKFELYETLKSGTTDGTSAYGYMIVNSVPGSPKLLLAPTPTEAGPYVKFWYLRNANRLSLDSDILDIPEAANYVMAYMRMKIYEKENHPLLEKAMADLQKEEADTVATLSAMIPDNQNELEADLRVYNEMS